MKTFYMRVYYIILVSGLVLHCMEATMKQHFMVHVCAFLEAKTYFGRLLCIFEGQYIQ